MITNIRFQYGMQRVGQDACNVLDRMACNVLDNSEHICMTDVRSSGASCESVLLPAWGHFDVFPYFRMDNCQLNIQKY